MLEKLPPSALEPLLFVYLLVDTGRRLTCEKDQSLFSCRIEESTWCTPLRYTTQVLIFREMATTAIHDFLPVFEFTHAIVCSEL